MSTPIPAAVSVHEAELGSGPEGAVEWGGQLTDAEAVARLQAGGDVVVRGVARRANRNKARELMVAAFGGFLEDTAHEGAGRMALPHFHPPGRVPPVHAFFEAPPVHSRRKR